MIFFLSFLKFYCALKMERNGFQFFPVYQNLLLVRDFVSSSSLYESKRALYL